MLVQARMTPDPVVVTPDDTLAHALRLTRAHRIRHLPVVGAASGKLVGVLSDRDMRLAMPSPLTVADAQRAEFLERTAVAAVMTRDVVTASRHETIEDAAKQMCRHRIGSLPVVDESDRLVGIITETDILRAFVEILSGTEPSSRLELALEDRPGVLSRAVRVLGEELKLNIVSIMVPPERRGEHRTAVIHLSTIDPREAVRELEAAGFRVGWPSLEAGELNAAPGVAQ